MVKVTRGGVTSIEFESKLSNFEFKAVDEDGIFGDRIHLWVDGANKYSFSKKELKIVAEALLEMVGD